MGFLKKVSNFAFGSSGPKYNMDKSAMTSQYGVQSDLGNMSVVKNADGTYSKNYQSNANDQARNNLISQGLGTLGKGFESYSLDPTEASQAYYDQATRLLNNQFDQQRRTADTNLINRGIQTGTDQYNRVMGDLQDRQNATLNDIANQSVYLGQQNLGQQISNLGGQIGNINSLGAGRDVYGVAGLGGQNDSYNDYYQSRIYNDAMRNQRNSNIMGTLGAIGGLAFSDKRLKENLEPVGKLNNGLKVYVGNYKKETGLDTTPQLFLLAQEVQKKHPEAVQKKFGALAVDYKQAVKKGE